MATPTTAAPTQQSSERPTLSVVKDPAAPVEGTVVEHQGGRVVQRRPRPAWILSADQLKRHAVYARDNAIDWAGCQLAHSPYYVGWSVRGYRRLARRWREAHHDDYPQLIRSAKQQLRDADSNTAKESQAKAIRDVRRAEYARHKKIHWIKTGAWGTAATAGGTTGVVVGNLWVDLLIALGILATGAWHGRPETPAAVAPQAPTRVSHLGEETMRRVLVEAGVVPERRAEEIRGVGIPHTEGPGIAFAVDLPSGMPASLALAKGEQMASALGVHKDWMDLEVDRDPGSSESRLKIWVSSEDPFAVVRRSPILDRKGKIDTWRDGIVADFGKRGDQIVLYIRDTSILAGGATRRGKGMLLANILIGVAKDPWVNVRIFDGKGTAEHNPFAPLAATFVKRNPERLALFLRAVVAELDRRSDLLDQRGLEKVDDEHYDELMKLLGGRELIIVDELATYTPKGTSPFADEITENLSQIAAVGASLGIILISLTQVPEVDVVRGRLRQNHVGRAAMKTESGTASNTILGDGMTGQGYNAAEIPITQPGRHWLVTPETGAVDARSYLVKPEEKREVAAEATELRRAAGRLPGQWRDPIEAQLIAWTGVSSAAGGERGNGRITRVVILERLEIFARSTGRGNVTNAEVFAALAVTDPSRYGRKDGEADAGWTTRVGKILKDEIDAMGVELESKRVPTADGKRPPGYLLDDILAARNAQK